MATPIFDKNKKTYSIRVFYKDKLGNKKQTYKSGFKTKKEALQWEYEFKTEQMNSMPKSITLLFPLIDSFLDYKINVDKIEKRTEADYYYYFDIVKQHFGNCEISSLTKLQLQFFINSFVDTPAKCRHIYSSLSALFNYAYMEDITENNIFAKVKKVKYEPKETSHYKIEEVNTILYYLKEEMPQYYVYALLTVVTGLRPGEATALTTDDIVCKDGQYFVFVNKSYSKVKNQVTKEVTIEIKKPKTKAGIRYIPISKETIEELNYYKNFYGFESKYIVCQLNGNIITDDAFNSALKRITTRHNLKHITPYGLRHTFSNTQKHLGTSDFTIANLMGHSSVTVTNRYYFHADDELNIKAINNISEKIEPKIAIK